MSVCAFMRRFSFGRPWTAVFKRIAWFCNFVKGEERFAAPSRRRKRELPGGAADGRGREVQKFHKGARVSLTNGFFACIMSDMKHEMSLAIYGKYLYRGEASGCFCA